MSTYAIGDIHGCFKELQALLAEVAFNSKNDSLWFVGDLVNRGPQSVEVLRFIRDLGSSARVVLGNHDLYTLYIQKHRQFLKYFPGLQSIFAVADSDDLLSWLRQRPLLHYDATLGYVMVHAGIYPFWSLSEAKFHAKEVEDVIRSDKFSDFLDCIEGDKPDQWSENLKGFDRLRFIVNSFTRMRFCDAQGRLNLNCKAKIGLQPKGYIPWFLVPNRKVYKEKIIFGHWAALDGQISDCHANVYALDTGCAWGNSLTAMRLEDERIFRVKKVTS